MASSRAESVLRYSRRRSGLAIRFATRDSSFNRQSQLLRHPPVGSQRLPQTHHPPPGRGGLHVIVVDTLSSTDLGHVTGVNVHLQLMPSVWSGE